MLDEYCTAATSMAMPISDTVTTAGKPFAQKYCTNRADGNARADPFGERANTMHPAAAPANAPIIIGA